MREFTAVSLFCGAGGLDLGFDHAGYKTIWANDLDKDACKTHRNWSKTNVVCGDISKTVNNKNIIPQAQGAQWYNCPSKGDSDQRSGAVGHKVGIIAV